MCARGDDPTPERDRSEKGAACRAMTVQVASASKKAARPAKNPDWKNIQNVQRAEGCRVGSRKKSRKHASAAAVLRLFLQLS
jgi:hypothetical protein